MDYWMLALAVAGVFIQNLFKKNYIAAQGAELIPSLLFNELTALAALALFALCRRAAPRPRGLGRSLAASALPNGLANGAVNLFVVLLAARLPASLMFPIISAGGVALTFLASRTVYRERLSPCQLAGFAAGILSVIVLSLS